jgi:hypothetical protein
VKIALFWNSVGVSPNLDLNNVLKELGLSNPMSKQVSVTL